MNARIDRPKLLIADNIREQVSSMTRVDKSDILELTVFHVTRLQQRQQSVRVVTDATEGGSSATSNQTGYRDCARGALNYLSENSYCSPEVATSVSAYLKSVYVPKQNYSQTAEERLQEVDNRTPKAENRVPFTYSYTRQNPQSVFMSTPRRSNEGLCALTSQIPTTSPKTLEFSPILRMTKCHDDVIVHNSSTLGFLNSVASFDMTTDI